MIDKSAYGARIAAILADLGIPATYGGDHGMPLQVEADDLVLIGTDIAGRERRLIPRAAGRWAALRSAADQDGIVLQVVSAFRSVEAQRKIFETKISRGLTVEEILKVNAAPGYSEHHTGRAVDVTSPGVEPLEEVFETSDAFRWLALHASRFDFVLSYPRGNPRGIVYEPWHWTVIDAP